MTSPLASRVVMRVLLGAALLFCAFAVRTSAVKDGGRTLEGWLIAMAGIYAIVGGIPGRWRSTSFLAGTLVIGVIGQLGMTDPLWLQHLRISPNEVGGGWSAIFYVLSGAQAALVLFLSWKFRTSLRTLFSSTQRVGWPRALAVGVIFIACAAHLTRYVDKPHFAWPSYVAQLAVTALLVCVNALNLLLVFLAAPTDAVRDLVARFAHVDWDRRLPRILAAWALVASLLLGFFALDFVPHIPDELAYIFQAECFARGMLFGAAPPSPESFDVYLVAVEGGRWYATTPPGWPAVLAIGAAAGVPWLINPILGALTILVAHALTRRLLGRREAHIVAFLLAVSPWFLYLSASYMTHTVSLFLAVSAWLALARAKDAGPSPAATPSWALLAGALLGWLALVRQLDAVLLALVLGLWSLGCFGKRLPWIGIVAFGAGCLAVASLILPFNAAMTGSPTEFPINAYLDKLWYPGANRLGFGADVGNPPGWGDLDAFRGHGLRDVLVNTNQNLYTTSYELFGWGIGSLFFVFVHVLFGRKTAIDRLMMFCVVTLLLGYHLYWYSGGGDFGARYWYVMIYPLLVLTLRGIDTTIAYFRSGVATDQAASRTAVVIGVLVITAIAVFLPWRAVARYKDYRGFHADYRRLAISDRALVFVKSARNSDFWSAFIRNSPDQSEARPIFAKDKGEAANQKLIDALPDRPVVWVEGRSVGGVTKVTATRPPRQSK